MSHLTERQKKGRVNLRNGQFMGDGDWSDINEEVREIIEAAWQLLREQWDAMYGDVNPISSAEDEND